MGGREKETRQGVDVRRLGLFVPQEAGTEILAARWMGGWIFHSEGTAHGIETCRVDCFTILSAQLEAGTMVSS